MAQKERGTDSSVGADGAQRSHRGEAEKAPPKQRLRKQRCASRGGADRETGGSGVGLAAGVAGLEALRNEMRAHMGQQQAAAQATANELMRRMDEITRLLKGGGVDAPSQGKAAAHEEQEQSAPQLEA